MYAVYIGITITICWICSIYFSSPQENQVLPVSAMLLARCVTVIVSARLSPLREGNKWTFLWRSEDWGGGETQTQLLQRPRAHYLCWAGSSQFTQPSTLYFQSFNQILSFLENFHKTPLQRQHHHYLQSAGRTPLTSDELGCIQEISLNYDYYDLCFRASVVGNIPRFTHNLFQHHLKGVTNAPIEKVSAVTIGQ